MEITISIDGRMASVEVSAEVAECLDAGRRKSENLTHIPRFRLTAKTRSFRCASSPHKACGFAGPPGVVRPAGGCCVLRTRWGLCPQTPTPAGKEHPLCVCPFPAGPISVAGRRCVFTAIFHCPIQIIQRSKGKSAVAAAAYRSGEKLVNEWDGLIHDYTHKRGIVHREILLPAHAPPEFSDRSTLWNSVEEIEKSCDAQLAREIEVALPVELSPAARLALVRSYIKDNFVAAGMCADFAIHDKGTGNPHAHIMLTMRPLLPDGHWGAKCRKVYDLDERGQRIPNGKGGWKSHREDTTDWNDRGNAEKWRAVWASCVNQALEAAGKRSRVDHRSYKRQGIEKIPTIHMGPAASQMERRGIATEKGDINRQRCIYGGQKYSVFKVPSTTPLLSHISTKNAKNQLLRVVPLEIRVSLIFLIAAGFFSPLYLTVTLQPST